MIGANVMFEASESLAIQTRVDHRRPFVVPVATVHEELGVLTLQSRLSYCDDPACVGRQSHSHSHSHRRRRRHHHSRHVI